MSSPLVGAPVSSGVSGRVSAGRFEPCGATGGTVSDTVPLTVSEFAETMLCQGTHGMRTVGASSILRKLGLTRQNRATLPIAKPSQCDRISYQN
jgi:hypothetical protein